jgi:hypothetical protein
VLVLIGGPNGCECLARGGAELALLSAEPAALATFQVGKLLRTKYLLDRSLCTLKSAHGIVPT